MQSTVVFFLCSASKSIDAFKMYEFEKEKSGRSLTFSINST